MARPKGTIDRVQTGMRLKKTLFKHLQHLSIDLETPVNVMVEEALEEYLQKHGHAVPDPQVKK
jgi:predicted DNA-binding protein